MKLVEMGWVLNGGGCISRSNADRNWLTNFALDGEVWPSWDPIQYQPAELLRHCYYIYFNFWDGWKRTIIVWELFQIGLRLLVKCALQHSPTSGYILIVRCSIFFGILSSVLRAYPSPFFAIGRWACFLLNVALQIDGLSCLHKLIDLFLCTCHLTNCPPQGMKTSFLPNTLQCQIVLFFTNLYRIFQNTSELLMQAVLSESFKMLFGLWSVCSLVRPRMEEQISSTIAVMNFKWPRVETALT